MIKESGEVYLLFPDGDFLLTYVNSSSSYPHYLDLMPDWIFWIAAFKCKKCNSTSLYSGEAEAFDSQERQMGNETFYGSTEYFNCPNCNEEVSITTTFTYYAFAWITEVESREVELVDIYNLSTYLEEWCKNKIELKNKETQLVWDSELIGKLRNSLDKRHGFLIIVEGDDDLEVIRQFFINGGIDMNRISIVKYGKGGCEEAIKFLKPFKSRILKEVPHLLILDSDNKKEEYEKKLKSEGFQKEEYYILDQKEIESYLIDIKAISTILSVPEKIISRDLKIKKTMGKEELDYIFEKHYGTKPNSQTKGLIAKNMDVPVEFVNIIEIIFNSLEQYRYLIEGEENYER